MKEQKNILVVDGNSLLYRCFFSTWNSGIQMTNSKGVHTNAIHGFLKSILSIIEKRSFNHIYFAFDKDKKTFRHKMFSEYKGTRKESPAELKQQFPLIREFLEQSGLGYIELEEYEADDIVGSIAKKFDNGENKIYIYSGDHDLYQLISKNILIIDPSSKNFANFIIGEKELYEKYKITPQQVPDYKGLCGDSSDNIKGVAGVGKVSAEKLLTEYKSIEGIYDNIDKITQNSLKQKLIDGKESAFFSKKLATIITDIKFESFNESEISIDFDKANKFLSDNQLKSVAKTFNTVFDFKVKEEEVSYTILEKWDSNIKGNQTCLFLETNSDNYHYSNVVGIGLNIDGKNFYYEPIFDNKNEILSSDNGTKDFFNFLTSTTIHTYDSKKLFFFLSSRGFDIDKLNVANDVMVGMYLLNPSIKSIFHNQISYLDPSISTSEFDEVFGKGAKKSFNISSAKKSKYFVVNSQAIYKSIDTMKLKLIDTDQLDTYNKIELPFAKLLSKIELNGIDIDEKILDKLANEAEIKLVKLEEDIRELLDDTIKDKFNISSPSQLKDILYNKLGLPDAFKGSTDREALDYLADKHEVIPLIIKHRKLSKTFSTYLKGMKKYIYKDGKIHTIYNQTLTATGRLSSSEPNMQNISVNDEEQKEIRKIFRCKDQNKIFISFDYSQIELRVVADMAKENVMLEMFNNQRDVHKETAKKIFDIKDDTLLKPEHRKTAKTVNFGILYGQTEFGLSKELNISIANAKKLIDSYFQTFNNIKKFQDETIKDATKTGFVKTVGNRIRYISELNSGNANLKKFGNRMAINTPIQGTAADIIKVAMLDVDKQIIDIDYKIVSQIHDEIIIMCDKKDEEILTNKVKQVMTLAFENLAKYLNKEYVPTVKLVVNSSSAIDWFGLK